MRFARATRTPEPQWRGAGRLQSGNDFGIESGPETCEYRIGSQSHS
jgi:hypothetical protein